MCLLYPGDIMGPMPELALDDVTLSYDRVGEGDPVVLVAGCSQPALAWQFSVVPALTAAGFSVLTFDNRGVAPSSSPEPPYSVEEMTGDALSLLDHLGWHDRLSKMYQREY